MIKYTATSPSIPIQPQSISFCCFCHSQKQKSHADLVRPQTAQCNNVGLNLSNSLSIPLVSTMQSGSQPTTLSVALLSHSVEGFPTKALHFVVKAEWERRRVASSVASPPPIAPIVGSEKREEERGRANATGRQQKPYASQCRTQDPNGRMKSQPKQ